MSSGWTIGNVLLCQQHIYTRRWINKVRRIMLNYGLVSVVLRLPPQPYSGIYYLWSFFWTWCHTSFWMTNQVIKLTLAQFAYDLFLLSSLDSGRFSVQQVAHNAVASKFVTTDSPLISLSGLFFHFMVRFSSSTDSFHVDKLIPGLHYHFSSRDYLQSVSLTACV